MGRSRGKRYRQLLEKVPDGPVSIPDAVDVLKSFDPPKFDATVEMSFHLGIDPRQADQALRGAVALPHGIGKQRRVVAFCEADDVDKAVEAGAVEAGTDDLIEKIQGGWADFDVAVASKSVMKQVSKLGRVLGPKGLMPSPKQGTVVDDVATAVSEYAAGKVEYRNDDGGNLHVLVGKVSFDKAKLVENIEAMVRHVRSIRPQSVKGAYMRKVAISAAMSPSVVLDIAARAPSSSEAVA
ncbi:MAG: 50S ribosomal protein L1 [Phycisphaerae bacterium]|nr:50S ribosomal protein L1 [Phycisphaerae bacterium]